MARLYDPSLIPLPRADAADAVAQAQALEAKARALKKSKYDPAIESALVDLLARRVAMQAELGKQAPRKSSAPKVADANEDRALAALHDLLLAMARLDGVIAEGAVAAKLFAFFFGESGLKIVNLAYPREWALVDSKLKTIDTDGLAHEFVRVGAGPVLEHLRAVHIEYGLALGVTKPTFTESPQIRVQRDELNDTIRGYVLQVVAWAARNGETGGELRDQLLQPLADWTSTPARQAEVKPSPSPTPAPAPIAVAP